MLSAEEYPFLGLRIFSKDGNFLNTEKNIFGNRLKQKLK
jgi:hypothetical protein